MLQRNIVYCAGLKEIKKAKNDVGQSGDLRPPTAKAVETGHFAKGFEPMIFRRGLKTYLAYNSRPRRAGRE